MFNFGAPTPAAEKPAGFSFQTPAAQSSTFSFPSATTSTSQPGAFQTPSNPFATQSGSSLAAPPSTAFPQQSPSFPAQSTFQTPQSKLIAPYQETHPLIQIKSILDSYDPSSPYYKFQHPFYNVVDPADLPKYTKPANVDDLLWEQAVRDNPSPSTMAPVIAVGFSDLEKRKSAQLEQLKVHQQKLEQIRAVLESLQVTHSVEFESQLAELGHKQSIIVQRIIGIIEKFQLYKNRGFSFSKEEEQLKCRLESLLIKVTRELKMKDKAFELAKQVENAQKQIKSYQGSELILPEDSLRTLESIFASQNAALKSLIDGVVEQRDVLKRIEDGCKDLSFVK